METFPWEVGDPPDGSRGAVADEVQASPLGSTVTVAGRSVMQMVLGSCVGRGDVGVRIPSSSQAPGASCKRIGRGYGWEMEPKMEAGDAHGVSTTPVEVGFQLDLGLTDITKYSSYSKLWRMLYFINDAPFCIHTHGYNHLHLGWPSPISGS